MGDKARRHPDEQILRDPVKLNANLETGRYAYPFVSESISIALIFQYYMTSYFQGTNVHVFFRRQRVQERRTMPFQSLHIAGLLLLGFQERRSPSATLQQRVYLRVLAFNCSYDKP